MLFRSDFAAWLGLVPKQMSTGDRTILGRISKRGNRYLRTLLMQGARVILLRPANWAKHSFIVLPRFPRLRAGISGRTLSPSPATSNGTEQRHAATPFPEHANLS